ncbi:hypothetical protein DV096_03450 [Bradymonadaceae bacterium TMQ3]|nr:hypothetical protein DV096_03450 [Bradymonadaceae bacterium TMQ3]
MTRAFSAGLVCLSKDLGEQGFHLTISNLKGKFVPPGRVLLGEFFKWVLRSLYKVGVIPNYESYLTQ